MLGIVADDVTGATDVAGRIVREGTPTGLLLGVPGADAAVPEGSGAVIVALRTRTAPAGQAVAESLAAALWLAGHGADHIFLKVSSTFDSTDRGNIGPVLDALAGEFGAERVVVCPATPENGRTVYRSRAFVGDALLAESSMRDHPLTPMRESDLRLVLARQSREAVGWVQRDDAVGGRDRLLSAIRTASGRHVIADAVDDADLDALAAAAVEFPVSAGAAGLGAALARGRRGGRAASPPRHPEGRAAILSGSCSVATRGQIAEYLSAREGFRVDPEALAAGEPVVAAALAYVDALGDAEVPLVYSSADPDEVARAQEALGVARAAELVEGAFAEITRGLLDRGVRRLIVAGGETSGAVVRATGASALVVGEEVAPGVPWVQSADDGLALLLKSGNFGRPDFFGRALG